MDSSSAPLGLRKGPELEFLSHTRWQLPRIRRAVYCFPTCLRFVSHTHYAVFHTSELSLRCSPHLEYPSLSSPTFQIQLSCHLLQEAFPDHPHLIPSFALQPRSLLRSLLVHLTAAHCGHPSPPLAVGLREDRDHVLTILYHRWLPSPEPGAGPNLAAEPCCRYLGLKGHWAPSRPVEILVFHSQEKDTGVRILLQDGNRELAFAEHLDSVPGSLHMWLLYMPSMLLLKAPALAEPSACNLLPPRGFPPCFFQVSAPRRVLPLSLSPALPSPSTLLLVSPLPGSLRSMRVVSCLLSKEGGFCLFFFTAVWSAPGAAAHT